MVQQGVVEKTFDTHPELWTDSAAIEIILFSHCATKLKGWNSSVLAHARTGDEFGGIAWTLLLAGQLLKLQLL